MRRKNISFSIVNLGLKNLCALNRLVLFDYMNSVFLKLCLDLFKKIQLEIQVFSSVAIIFL